MSPRRSFLAAGLLGACAAPDRPSPPLSGETAIVAAEAWHTDICLPAGALSGGPLAALAARAPGAAGFALGFGLESWMRAERPGSGEALAALSGGPAVVSVRALPGAVPPGTEDAVTLRLPAGGPSAIAHFVAGQVTGPLDVRPDGGWTLLPSRLRYSLGFTCNTWVMEALFRAGLPVPVAGMRFRTETMAALWREAARQGR